MTQGQTLREARREVLLQDQAAYRSAVSQQQRAAMDSGAAAPVITPASPLTLPAKSPAEFSSFVQELASTDSDSYASLLMRLQAASLPPAPPRGLLKLVQNVENAYELVADTFGTIEPALLQGNLQAIRQYLNDQNKADSILAMRSDKLLRAARPALQLAHTQLATAKPDANGRILIDLPVFCELRGEGLVQEVDAALEMITSVSRMDAKYLPVLEQLVLAAEKQRLVSVARMARRSDRSSEELDDETVLELARTIAAHGESIAHFAACSMHPQLLMSLSFHLFEAGAIDKAVALGWLSREVDSFVKAHLTEDGVSVADPENLLQNAHQAVLKMIDELECSEEAKRVISQGLALSLAETTLQNALCHRVPQQHIPAIMAEFGWDFASDSQTTAVDDVTSALSSLEKMAKLEDTVVASRAAFAEQLGTILEDHTDTLIKEDCLKLSKGTQRFVAAQAAESGGLAALLQSISDHKVLSHKGDMKPSEIRAAAADAKQQLLSKKQQKNNASEQR